MVARCVTEAFSIPPVQYIYNIVRAGGCLAIRSSVAEHWQLNPEVAWVQLLGTANLFTFHFITSEFLYWNSF